MINQQVLINAAKSFGATHASFATLEDYDNDGRLTLVAQNSGGWLCWEYSVEILNGEIVRR